MGSLNGDIMVMRNGRSTSQVSVYNYPEHLNPFYEDDQHKRLRFWKISKNDNQGRRNSFSFGNLKDMWSFKSFRLKKKSSTLGISKTSESPPPLRRTLVADNNGWNTFDNRMRHSAASSVNGDSFQRNAIYRSSLQTLPTNNIGRMGFNRNDDYRSTIQVPRPNPRIRPQPKQQPHGVRYVYGGSVTPQPLRTGPYDSHRINDSVNRGSSMSSMGGTNPFDSDDDEDNADASAMRSINGGSTSTLSKSTPRKKRRAPAPPTPIHGRTPTIHIESSQNTSQNDELCIREDTDIAHLTAEIESFVKDKSNEDIEAEVKTETRPNASPQTPPTSNVQGGVVNATATTVVITTTTTTPTASPRSQGRAKETKADEMKSEKIKEEMKSEEVVSAPPPKGVRKIEKEHEVESSAPVIRDADKANAAATKPETTKNIHSPQPVPRDTNKVSQAATTLPDKDKAKLTQVAESKTVHSPRQMPHTNGQVKTEIITVRTSTSVDVDKTEVVPAVSKMSPKTEKVTKDFNSNGAIPKKSNEDMAKQTRSIQVTGSEAVKVQLKRSAKTDVDQGQVECIHVHVGSPSAMPRQEHANSLSSFKQEHNKETTEIITTKTPFILTSPPAQRKAGLETKQTKEIVNAFVVPKSNAATDLSIQEDQEIARSDVKPKPPLSPKPVLERNDRVHAFAEIHKPLRSKINQTSNGHVRRESHEELPPSPPIVPQQRKVEGQEQKLKVDVPETTTDEKIPAKTEVITNSLKITESPTTHAVDTQSSSASSPAPQCNDNGMTGAACERQEQMDFEALYRPKPQSHMEWKQSTLAPLETHIPPEKRKSVKDIIESINRSQRLLHAAANKDFTIITSGSPADSCDAVPAYDEAERIPEQSPRQTNRQVQHIEEASTCAQSPPSYSECVAVQKMDNSEIFQKCKVNKEVYDYRETSPITSNLDWNPVPKPKRTKNQND